jgi:hypothetical protein
LGKAGALALVCLGLAYASLAQGIGWNQLAHYALVRALADGSAVVDPYRDETGDVSWVDGHYYAAKAPGLAFATLPLYLALDRLGVKDLMANAPGAADEAVGMLWALGLIGCVLPAVGIALLVRRLGDEVEPGLGVLAAVALGTGTLLLPFATLFFAHVLAAALAFAAFGFLWLRSGRFALFAGLLAGLAVVADYPLALAAGLVGLYALSRSVRTGLAYAAGAIVGALPLLAYQWWAFGSPAQLAYEDAVLVGGTSGHDVLGANSTGFFGIGAPSFGVAVELLFAPVGLLRLSPVLALAAAGVALMFRRGFRAEALLIASVALGYLVYNSGYFQPFGGFVPGPRFLVPVLPFLGVGLAPAFRRLPLTTLALAGCSTALLTAVTITGPLLAFDGRWHERLTDGWFGGRSWLTVVPFVALVGGAAFLAVRAARPRISASEWPTAGAAVGAWLLLWLIAPERLEGWAAGDVALVSALAALAAVAVFAASQLGARSSLAQSHGR